MTDLLQRLRACAAGPTGTDPDAFYPSVIVFPPDARQLVSLIDLVNAVAAGQTLPADFTEDQARAFVAALPVDHRDQLWDLIKERNEAVMDDRLAELIKAAIAEYDSTDAKPVAVMFTAGEADNGHFFNGYSATVFFTDDGPTSYVTLGDEVDHILTRMYGAVGQGAALAYNLLTDEWEFDSSYGDEVAEVVRGWADTARAKS